MKNTKLKKSILILIFGCIILGCIRYKNDISNIVYLYYCLCRDAIDTTLFYAIEICVCALIGILICWLMARSIDKKRGKTAGKPFDEAHPKLNMIIAIFILIIMTVCGWTVIYYVFSYLAQVISNLVDWMSVIASKLDAVVIVAFITGGVSIVGVIISSIVAKVIDFRKNRQDYLAKKSNAF